MLLRRCPDRRNRTKEIVEALPGEMERLGIEKLSDIIGCIE